LAQSVGSIFPCSRNRWMCRAVYFMDSTWTNLAFMIFFGVIRNCASFHGFEAGPRPSNIGLPSRPISIAPGTRDPFFLKCRRHLPRPIVKTGSHHSSRRYVCRGFARRHKKSSVRRYETDNLSREEQWGMTGSDPIVSRMAEGQWILSGRGQGGHTVWRNDPRALPRQFCCDPHGPAPERRVRPPGQTHKKSVSFRSGL
jgi:hypothetical protein